MPDASVPVLDESVLEELVATTGDDTAFVRELLETYLADLPVQLDGMDEAIRGNDAEALVRPAHTLKSASAAVGVMRLSAVSRELEMAGRSGALNGAATAAMAQAHDEARAATEAVHRWLAEQLAS
jgi:HPt (histidine-containing phosphotransfer) domain-containing protein